MARIYKLPVGAAEGSSEAPSTRQSLVLAHPMGKAAGFVTLWPRPTFPTTWFNVLPVDANGFARGSAFL